MTDYKDTLNLPSTDFPMRASLPEREAGQIKKWNDQKVFSAVLEKNRNKQSGKFLLHDGPPYANNSIHLGHALNKILKDVVVKYKNLMGLEANYIPGWDCHGLPIELGVEKQLKEEKKDKNSLPIVEIRKLCEAYAQKFVNLQMEQFKSLEIFSDWEHPYRTMDREYVSEIIRSLGRCAERGVLYRKNKPVHWCPSCRTALAEAEIEYANKKSPSIYVKFEIKDRKIGNHKSTLPLSIVIWTTTPWTLPANLLIAVHPDLEYVVLEWDEEGRKEGILISSALREAFESAVGRKLNELPGFPKLKGSDLDGIITQHPFIDRTSMIVTADHVTTEAGTGAVHTAPGHGVEDYRVGLKMGTAILSPVDERGCYTSEFEPMKGTFVFKANEPIIEKLKENRALIHRVDIEHSYPHCWRCHQAVIFRATPQWFISVDDPILDGKSLRERAKEQIHQVTWVPSWGINRILGMIETRPDWCISRQRIWGVPITVFYCEECDEALASPEIFKHVADIVEKEGPSSWFEKDVSHFLPAGTICEKCKSTKFKKEKDILDVWFDSGVSHIAVCERRGLGWPADLYLEGSDQHRGWFQTSLLTAVAIRGHAPYQKVLTHGFVNDQYGKKMSKSQGNVTSPLDIVKSNGADILRLWVTLEDYRNDVSFSKESLDRVSEGYRRIRNTLRFILGNLYDFDADRDSVPLSKMGELDRWAVSRFARAMQRIHEAYSEYEFHTVYHQVMNLCSVELSSIYFDILKDRLYVAKKDSQERRASQTALNWMLEMLARVLAPIIPFTSEEVWGFAPVQKSKKTTSQAKSSVFLGEWPEWKLESLLDEEIEKRFEKIWEVRENLQKALEEARRNKAIGHQREAKAVVKVPRAHWEELSATREDLSRLMLVSQVELQEGPEIQVRIEKADGQKCARCWVYSPRVGTFPEHPEICDRCIEALN